ncbi:nitroreductase [Actinoplanes campanulatus]|uniref:Nitroreductase n=1 Tax=Actinoplanes campanulatus TaxID=113559 RepID=A0A7W5ATL6_9ACTN|nr:nitroreductase family protein [Actinoplanes campanulatus]MBB3101599.1 nitroreductase [Actinoplanes campanulatus]GGN48739.1 hypothetical protein GCM10010109_86110 [Actinoplanes campanulatus]GID41674.1 hypothetical protein Aca09nite_81800 [Actinoplanes campanulatus]
MTVDVQSNTGQLALAKNFLVRSPADDSDLWEVSWGEGNARCYYTFPQELAVFFMTCDPAADRDEWTNRLTSELHVSPDESSAIVATLIEDGLLADPADSITPGEEQWLEVEWADALQLHWAERNSRWVHDYTHNPKVMTTADGENVQPTTPPPGPFPCVPAPGRSSLRLPDALSLNRPFRDAQRTRRTSYRLQGTSITLPDVATVLQWTLRAPWSDGGVPLRVSQSYSRGEPFVGFVAFGAEAPDGCEPHTIYQYDPASNILAPRPSAVPEKWSDLLWGQHFADGAAMALILAVNWDHHMWKYRFPRAYRWVYTECGVFMQTALTVAAGLGLHAWQTPALDDEAVSDLIGYSEGQLSPIYLAAFGRADAESD